MNRRSFFGLLFAAPLAISGIRLNQRPHSLLERNTCISTRDDSDFIQSCVDSGREIPRGEYFVRKLVDCRGKCVISMYSTYHFANRFPFVNDSRSSGYLRFCDFIGDL